MNADGTITLRLRSLPPGPIAEGTLHYAPSDARYDEIVRHIGGMAPGESKSVPPLCRAHKSARASRSAADKA